MADAKRDRQRAARQAKIEAELAAKKRAARQRQAIIGGAIFAVLAAVVLIVNRDDGDKTVETSTSTTALGATATTLATATTTPAAVVASAAGQPCVPRSQPLPESAPEVDVEVGAPPTALVSKDLVVGTGSPVPAGAEVTVNYIGVSCSTGVIFDSSYETNPPTPITFRLDGVIKGWTDGIPGMNVGGRRLLGIPPDLAYGAPGRAPSIAPQETLWFVVDMVDFKPAA